jgi:hypothetical protein
VILAELEVRHTRSIVPTRRVALGPVRRLPTDPPPGFGGILLAGIVAGHLDRIDPDVMSDLHHLVDDVAHARRMPQPRLRYRFQVDTHGLVRTRHRLVGRGQTMAFDFDRNDSPLAQVLGAVYCAGRLEPTVRGPVAELLRRSLRWSGPPGPALMTFLTGGRSAHPWSLALLSDPHVWALGVLGFERHAAPTRREIQRRFRHGVRAVHPDHGAETAEAAQRVTDLTQARRILLG